MVSPNGVAIEVLKGIWIVLPAYVANAAPLVFARIYPFKRHPIDMGRKLGRERILGDSKSIEGFVVGVAMGTLVGWIQEVLGFGSTLRGFCMGLGAMVGDCVGAFIKRRLGIAPGAPAPVLDQLTFLLFALLFTAILGTYPLNAFQTIVLIPVTLGLHLATNVAAYLMKIKNVPW